MAVCLASASIYSWVRHLCTSWLLGGCCLQVITRAASTRVAEYAFQYARDNKRQKVSALHKANIMKKADGLFIECCREVAGMWQM